jgi:hypothetical protein
VDRLGYRVRGYRLREIAQLARGGNEPCRIATQLHRAAGHQRVSDAVTLEQRHPPTPAGVAVGADRHQRSPDVTSDSGSNLPRSEGIGFIEGDEGKVRLTCKDLSV